MLSDRPKLFLGQKMAKNIYFFLVLKIYKKNGLITFSKTLYIYVLECLLSIGIKNYAPKFKGGKREGGLVLLRGEFTDQSQRLHLLYTIGSACDPKLLEQSQGCICYTLLATPMILNNPTNHKAAFVIHYWLRL